MGIRGRFLITYKPKRRARLEKEKFPVEWLRRKTTIEEVEEKEITEKSHYLMLREWRMFKSSMKPGDELWEFCSPQETWAELMGRAGYVILRKGETVAEIVTMEN
jgi:hypothetical protein